MADPNRALFESVVRLLAPVLDELVFVGGCTTGLFITDPAAGGIRPTRDVDAIVDVTSYAKYTALAERLRALGLGEDTTPGASRLRPSCWETPATAKKVDVTAAGGLVVIRYHGRERQASRSSRLHCRIHHQPDGNGSRRIDGGHEDAGSGA